MRDTDSKRRMRETETERLDCLVAWETSAKCRTEMAFANNIRTMNTIQLINGNWHRNRLSTVLIWSRFWAHKTNLIHLNITGSIPPNMFIILCSCWSIFFIYFHVEAKSKRLLALNKTHTRSSLVGVVYHLNHVCT